jgi:hypothetical protein
MADNVAVTAGSGTSIAADDISSVFYQRVKISHGADGSATDTSGASPLPVRTPVKYVTVSMSTATNAHTAGDVVAATQIVAACTPGDDLPSLLHSIALIDTDDQKAALTLVFFDANTSLGVEEAAPDIDDTEVLTYIGHVDIVAGDYKDLGLSSVVNLRGINLPVKPATGTDDIYMAIFTPGTPTYASAVITVRLGFI